jgi:hypothetical protein
MMDEEGPEWCLTNLSYIVEHMAKEAKARHLPFSKKGAGLLVKLAVYKTRKKLGILAS